MTFPDIGLPVVIEILIDGVWETITSDVRGITAPGGGIRFVAGKQDEQTDTQAGRAELALKHSDGRYDNLNPRSDLFGKFPIGTQIRVSINDSRISEADRIRFVHEFTAFPPVWEKTGTDVWVPVTTNGVLQRITEGKKEVVSAMQQFFLSFGDRLMAYVPLEEDSENFNAATNLVPGTFPIIYATGAGPDYPKRPNWAGDSSLVGSAPLPTWPVLAYFGWSVGGSVAVHGWKWQVVVAFKVPVGTDNITYLCEWKTDGIRPNYQMRVSGTTGILHVRANPDEDGSTITQLNATDAGDVRDGEWHTAAFSLYNNDPTGGTSTTYRIGVDGVENFGTWGNTRPGRVTKIRPRPLYTDIAGDPEPIGLGHMAVLDFARPLVYAPIDGHDGETVIERFKRLANENLITHEVFGESFIVDDDFARITASGWGTADSGQPWTTQVAGAGNYTFDTVDTGDGSARITANADNAFGNEATTLIEPGVTDVDVVATVSTDNVSCVPGIALRVTTADSWYTCRIGGFNNGSDGSLLIEEGSLSIASGSWFLGEFLTGVKYKIRAQSIGDLLRMKVWRDGEFEPSAWQLSVTDATLTTGGVGILVRGSSVVGTVNPTGGIVSVHDFQANALDDSVRMGPQLPKTLIGNFREIEATDQGFLYEMPREFGIGLRPRKTLENQEPALELDYDSGVLSEPFLPVIDRQNLHNDVTVQNAARAVLEEGPNSILEPPDGAGPFDRGPIAVNLQSDPMLSPLAYWILNARTVNAHRFPEVNLRLERQNFQDSASLFAAAASIRIGDLVRVNNPPTWLPPGPLDLIVVGKSEEHEQFSFPVGWNVIPADPYRIALPYTVGGMRLDGMQSASSTPDDAALDITGDIDMRADVTLVDWTPATKQGLLGKFVTPGDQRSYLMRITTGGLLQIVWSEDGTNTTQRSQSSTVPVPLSANQRLSLRATLDVDDGLGNRIVTFYVAPPGNVNSNSGWIQLGTAVTTAGVTSIFNSNSALTAGAWGVGTSERMSGILHRLQVRSGIGGTVVADPNFEVQADGTTSFTDSAGRLWTIASNIIQERINARRDTLDSQTHAAFTSGTNTALEVVTRKGPRWTTESAHMPLNIKTSGVELQATAIAPAFTDTFTRSETDAWGNGWAVNGTAANFDVDGDEGTIVGSVNGEFATRGDYTDVELLCKVKASTLNGEIALVARWTDPDNYYSFEMDLDAGSQSIDIWRIVGGIPTNIQSRSSTGLSFTADTYYSMYVKVMGSQLFMKVWLDVQTESSAWKITVKDENLVSGAVGCGAFNATGIKTFDDFQVLNPQTFTVVQSPVNGIAKAIPVGSQVRLADSPVRALRK